MRWVWGSYSSEHGNFLKLSILFLILLNILKLQRVYFYCALIRRQTKKRSCSMKKNISKKKIRYFELYPPFPTFYVIIYNTTLYYRVSYIQVRQKKEGQRNYKNASLIELFLLGTIHKYIIKQIKGARVIKHEIIAHK